MKTAEFNYWLLSFVVRKLKQSRKTDDDDDDDSLHKL